MSYTKIPIPLLMIAYTLWLLPYRSFGQSPVIQDGAKLIQVAADFTFTEGPAVDPDGNIYFTDQPNDHIYKWSTDFVHEKNFLPPKHRSVLYYL